VPRFSTIQAAITRELRDDIVSGRLAPGARLVVEDLAAKFEVSPMPVREALRQLDAEGLVVTHSFRGATVAALSIGEIREIFLMRRLLESEAARRGARAMGPRERLRLEALMGEMCEAVHDHGRWITADRAFHMTVYEASGYPRLVGLIGRLRQDIERYVRLYITLEHNIPRSMQRHEEILAACRAGDGAAARRATLIHLDETAEMFIAELERTRAREIAARLPHGTGAGLEPDDAATAGRVPDTQRSD
jgi:DNA-binding GntR family transcriptional regulator